ncbi:hypothetical protein K438DRAFT_1828766, partial [Mycena galopus ATCC 62051]
MAMLPLSPHLTSCVLQDLFLVFLIGNGEQTLEARPSQFFHPAMSQVRLSGPVGVCVLCCLLFLILSPLSAFPFSSILIF